MNRAQQTLIIAARVLVAVVFLLNGLGIIDQSEALRELIQRGTPVSIAPALLFVGRTVEVVAGFSLAFGFYSRLSAIALFLFLIPVTWVGHPFWLVNETPLLVPQLINFFKNLAIMGGLIFIASIDSPIAALNLRHNHRDTGRLASLIN